VVIIENIVVSKYLSPNMELQPITSKVYGIKSNHIQSWFQSSVRRSSYNFIW